MLKFVLTVDCESTLSLRQTNPRWGLIGKVKGKINFVLSPVRYNKVGFELVYNEIKNQKFPCTLMLVGSLYNPRENLSFIEWGYHTAKHHALTLMSDEEIEKEVYNRFGVESITTPLWMVEDVNNPARVFNILRKNGYKNVVYKGKDDGIKCLHYLAVKKPEKRYGIKCVHLSNCFEGNSSEKHMMKIKKEILSNLDKNAVYLLSTHDFTHRNNKNLRNIINFVKKLEQDKKIKVLKLKDA